MAQELWNGADVRWTGRARTRRGVRLQPGDRAVVVDAGRHHVGSFASFSRGPSRTSRGVLLRLVDTTEVRVSPRHLEVVAPDHPLRPEGSRDAADWWLSDLGEWGSTLPVAAFVPRRLPAVGRVLHPWEDRAGDAVRWEDVVRAADVTGRAELARRLAGSPLGLEDPPDTPHLGEPREGELDEHTARVLVDVLAGATTTPDDVFFAVWHGWGDTPPARFPGAAHIDTPRRGHFLLRGPLEGALTSVSALRSATRPVSGVWWPADRAWLLHTEVDFHWTFVGGSHRLVDDLVAHEELEVLPATHDEPANLLPEGR